MKLDKTMVTLKEPKTTDFFITLCFTATLLLTLKSTRNVSHSNYQTGASGVTVLAVRFVKHTGAAPERQAKNSDTLIF